MLHCTNYYTLQLQLHFFTLHYTTLDYTTLYHTTAHNTTVHYNTLQYATLVTPHHNYNCNFNCNYTIYTTLELQLTTTTPLHYSYSYKCTTPHHMTLMYHSAGTFRGPQRVTLHIIPHNRRAYVGHFDHCPRLVTRAQFGISLTISDNIQESMLFDIFPWKYRYICECTFLGIYILYATSCRIM